MLGGLVSLIANAYFARKVLIDGDKGSAQSLMLSWYVAEFLKIVMTVVLLAAVYTVVAVNALALLGAFFVAYVAGSVASAWVKLPAGKADERGG